MTISLVSSTTTLTSYSTTLGSVNGYGDTSRDKSNGRHSTNISIIPYEALDLSELRSSLYSTGIDLKSLSKESIIYCKLFNWADSMDFLRSASTE